MSAAGNARRRHRAGAAPSQRAPRKVSGAPPGSPGPHAGRRQERRSVRGRRRSYPGHLAHCRHPAQGRIISAILTSCPVLSMPSRAVRHVLTGAYGDEQRTGDLGESLQGRHTAVAVSRAIRSSGCAMCRSVCRTSYPDLPACGIWPGVRRAGLPKAARATDAGPAARAARRLDFHYGLTRQCMRQEGQELKQGRISIYDAFKRPGLHAGGTGVHGSCDQPGGRGLGSVPWHAYRRGGRRPAAGSLAGTFSWPRTLTLVLLWR